MADQTRGRQVCIRHSKGLISQHTLGGGGAPDSAWGKMDPIGSKVL